MSLIITQFLLEQDQRLQVGSIRYQKIKRLSDYLVGNGVCIVERKKGFGGGTYENRVTYSERSALDILQMMVFDQDNILTSFIFEFNKIIEKSPEQDTQFWEQPFQKTQYEYEGTHKKKEIDSQTFVQNLLIRIVWRFVENQLKLKPTTKWFNMESNAHPVPQVGKIIQEYKQNNRYFLRMLGNVILRHIQVIKNKLIFKHSQEVIALRLQADGKIQIRLQNKSDEKGQNNQIPSVTKAFSSIRAKSVILCVGREQSSQCISQIILINQKEQLQKGTIQKQLKINSEEILDESGLIKLCEHLQVQNNKRGGVIVVNEGTQSALEAIDILLNGIVTYKINESQNVKTNFVQKRINCEFSTNKEQDPYCYGSLKSLKWKWQTTDVVTPIFSKNDIIIIQTKNYELRGRAEELMSNIISGKETRVCIIKKEDLEKEPQILKEAAVIVEGSNLDARTIPIFNTDGNQIAPLRNFGCYDLDQYNRLKVDKGSIRNIYAFGSCGIPQKFIQENPNLASSQPGFYYTSSLDYFAPALKLIQETSSLKESLFQQGWYDQNEFPRTRQSSAFLSKADDFDSGSQSVHSDIVEQETLGLNTLKQKLSQDKSLIKFEQVEKMQKGKKK